MRTMHPWSVHPESRRLGARIPAAIDLSHLTGGDSSTAKRSAIGVSVLEDYHYKRMPLVTVGVAL